MRHPERVAQRLLAHDLLLARRRHLAEHQARIDVAQLEKGVQLELQVVRLEVLHEVDVGARVDGDGGALAVGTVGWWGGKNKSFEFELVLGV